MNKKIMGIILLNMTLLAACGEVKTNQPGQSRKDQIQENQVQPEEIQKQQESGASEEKAANDNVFRAGVWQGYSCGEYSYYFFNEDGISGSTVSAQMGIGVGFEYSIRDGAAVFYMGSADNAVEATLQVTDEEHIILLWGDGIQDELSYISDQTAEEFVFYTDDELCRRALDYYEKSKKNPEYEDLTAEAIVNENGSVTIALYADGEKHTATDIWYTVDRRSAAGKDAQGNEVYLILDAAK